MATTYEVKTIFKLIDQFTHPLRVVEKEGRGLGDLLKNQYASAERTINAIPGKLLDIGKVAVGVGAGAIAAGIGVATKEYIAFDKNLQQAGATFGDLDITAATYEEQLNAIAEGTQAVARLTKFNSEQASRAMFTMAQAGLSSVAALEVLPKAADTATVAGLSLDDAFEKVATTISNMQMAVTGDNFEIVSDIMNKMSTSAKMTFDDATAAMANAAGSFATLGLPVQSLGAAIQVLAEKGLSGAEAGTKLDAAMRQITTPAKLKQIEAMGVAVSDSFGNMLPLSDIVEGLNQKLSKLGNVEQKGILTSIFAAQGSEAMSRLLAAGADRIREVEEAMYNSTGTTEKMAAAMNQSIDVQIELLKSALSGLGQSFVSVFKTDGVSAIQKLTAVVNDFTENVLPKITDVVKSILPVVKKVFDAFIAGLPTIYKAIQFVLPVLKVVAGAFALVVRIAWALRGPIVVALGLFAAFKTVMLAVAAATKLWGVVVMIATTPITWIVLAIAGLIAGIVLLIKHWNSFGAVVTGVLEIIFPPLGMLISIIHGLVENWGAIVQTFKDEGIVAGILKIGSVLFNSILEPIKILYEKIQQIPVLGKIITTVVETVKGAFDGAVTILNSFLNPFYVIPELIGFITQAWNNMTDAFVSGGFFAGIKAIGGAILSFILAPIEKVLSGLTWIPGIGGKIAEWQNSVASFRAELIGSETSVAPITARDAQSIQTERLVSETENNSNVTIGLEKGVKAEVSGKAPNVRVMQYHSGAF